MIGAQSLLGGLFFLFMVALAFAGMVIFAHLVGRIASRPGAASKREPFECGNVSDRPAPDRPAVTFYIVGLLLLIFDVEVVFLYPWAVEFKSLGLFGFVEMLVFIGMLLVGYVYLLKRGALRW